jgi:AraC-like DNA-binding protein
MKSAFEKVRIEARSSVALLDRRLPDGIPFEWHHHPEFELTLTLNSRGHRFVGDHIGPYDDGDLVLVGPNLPHTWCSAAAIDPSRPHVAIVSWFSEAWMVDVVRLMPELEGILALAREARRGIWFSTTVAREVRAQIQRLPGAAPDDRLITLLQVLRRLAADPQRQLLAERTSSVEPVSPEPRLQRVLEHLHAHFDEPVDIARLAEIACLSPSALHRMFRRHARMTPIVYVVKLRIGSACSMLMEGNPNIAAVAARVGYRNLANFNRQFRTVKGVSPSQFRALYRRKGRVPFNPPDPNGSPASTWRLE